jgi:hypothetical protein
MRILNRKNYAWLLFALIALGCGDTGNKESAGSAVSGLFGPSETEKANAKEREAQIQKLQNQAQQMQKDRLDTYQK